MASLPKNHAGKRIRLLQQNRIMRAGVKYHDRKYSDGVKTIDVRNTPHRMLNRLKHGRCNMGTLPRGHDQPADYALLRYAVGEVGHNEKRRNRPNVGSRNGKRSAAIGDVALRDGGSGPFPKLSLRRPGAGNSHGHALTGGCDLRTQRERRLGPRRARRAVFPDFLLRSLQTERAAR